jgi:hypothetical protein
MGVERTNQIKLNKLRDKLRETQLSTTGKKRETKTTHGGGSGGI